MCGIIAAFNTSVTKKENKKKVKAKATPINQFIINQFQDQYKRGVEGFGILRIDPKQNIELDRACETSKFMLDLYMKESEMIIAHHRTPTSTDNLMNQTHPMKVSDKQLEHDYYVVHNGIISNADDLFDKHIEQGFSYTTEYEEEWGTRIETKFNDSESLAIELALFIENKIDSIGTDNTAAFIVLQVDRKTQTAKKVFFGKNSSACLNMAKTRGALRLSSEGKGDSVKENLLYSFDIKDASMDLSKRAIPFKKFEIKKEIKIENKASSQAKNLLSSGNITKKETEKTDVKEESKDIEMRVLRTWATPSDYNDMEELPEVITEEYIEERTKALEFRLQGEDSKETKQIVEDFLDEEIQTMQEFIEAYKKVLLTDRVEVEDKNFFTTNIENHLELMRELTESAEIDFQQKVMEEELDEQEINDYNTGYLPDARKNYHFQDAPTPTKNLNSVKSPLAGFRRY